MTVKEFCKKYSLKYQTVYKKIAHHKNKELAGHITKIKGVSIDLDDYAVDFLTPFNVKVIRTVEECEAVISENSDLKDRLYAAELNLEQAEAKLSDITADNKKLSAKITELTANLSALLPLTEKSFCMTQKIFIVSISLCVLSERM